VSKKQPPRQDDVPLEDTSLRTLPHNLEAEKALLGAVLINHQLLASLQGVVTPEHFFRRAHQAIFSAMLRLADRKEGIDIVIVFDELRRSGELDECGGPAYISSLTDGVPRSSNVHYYAGMVKADAMRRALITAANQALVDAYDRAKEPREIINAIDKNILTLQKGGERSRFADARERAALIYEKLEFRSTHKGQLIGLDTGFESINYITQGWQKGDLVVIAARPSVGKTAFVLNTAEACATAGKGVLIFSLEMRYEQLETRRLAHLSQVDASSLMDGHLGETQYARIVDALTKMHERPFYVDDRGGQTWEDIRATCRRTRIDKPLDLIIVDYVQLMPGSGERRAGNRTQEIDEIALNLKSLADEVSCPLLLLSQLNRSGAARSDNRPILSDLRDSGALEQHADLVCFLHRKNHKEDGRTEFIIEKARNGPTGTANLSITRSTQTFVDAGVEPDQPALPEAPPPQEPKPPKHWRRAKTLY
jgi:replicative DNA helicase